MGNVDYREFYKNHRHFILPDDVDDYDGFLLGALDVCVTTRCSLRCRGCAHLMYMYERREDWAASEVISALERVFSVVGYIARVNIIGGEPLLYRDLPKLLDYIASKRENIGIVKLTTNGTVVPKDPKVYEALRHGFMKVCISNYDLPNTHARELKEKLADEGVLYTDTIYDLDEGWYDFGECSPHGRTEEELTRQYSRCDVEWFSLYRNRIYACPRAAHMDALGLFDAGSDSVSVYDPDLEQKLWHFVYERRSHECCDYCNLGTDEISHIPVARQIGKR